MARTHRLCASERSRNSFCLLFSMIPTTLAPWTKRKKKNEYISNRNLLEQKSIRIFFNRSKTTQGAATAKTFIGVVKVCADASIGAICVLPCVWCFPFICKSIKCVKMNDTFAVMRITDISVCISAFNVLLPTFALIPSEPLDRILYISWMRQSATFQWNEQPHSPANNHNLLLYDFFLRHLNSTYLLEFIAHPLSTFVARLSFKSSREKSCAKTTPSQSRSRETNKFNTWGFFMLTYAIHVVNLLRLCVYFCTQPPITYTHTHTLRASKDAEPGIPGISK